MELLILFFITVAANVASHYINKMIDKHFGDK